MPTIELPDIQTRDSLIADRRRRGLDTHDEVWDGSYVVMPNPDMDHQRLATRLSGVFPTLVDDAGLGETFAGANVTSDPRDWTQNYRVPDVLVFLRDNPAARGGIFAGGGPDLCVEIVSPRDRSREKLDFYASVGTREVVVLDRDPWQVEVYRLDGEELVIDGVCKPGDPPVATSAVPLSWQLVPDEPRPSLALTADGERVWRL